MNRAFLIAALVCCAAAVAFAGNCDIDGTSRQQTMDGFGFSTAWCGKLSAAKNNALYNTLGFSILRIRVDEWGNFNDERDNTAAAHAAGAKVFGTAWTAPPSWNSNGKSTGGFLNKDHYGDFANYLKNAAQTINVDYVSFANEPDFGGANGIYFSEPDLRYFLKTYAKSLGKPIVYPETFSFNDAWSDPALNDPQAAALITYVAGHIYGGGNRVHQNALNKGKHVWETEHYLSGPNDIKTCLDEAQQLTQLLQNQFSAYCWWWVNDALAPNENLVKQSGEINLIGYTIGQFAKWIRPGYVRVGSSYNPTSGIYTSAYMGSEFVIVAVNQGGGNVQQNFNIKGVSGLGTLTIHRTDNAGHRMSNVGTVTVTNGAFSLNLPGQSISTIHGTYSGAPPPPGPQSATCGATAAEGDSLSLSCAAGQVISSVDFASYGTPTGDCSTGFAKSTCDANTTLSVLNTQCVGKNSCSVAGTNDVFGDPCPTVQKHLAAKVTCVGSCGVTAAEGETLKLTCPAGKIITGLDFASYGTPTGDCSSSFAKSTCDSATTVSVVNSKCLGQSSCSVVGSNDVFGDPCATIQKHLSVNASCAAPLAADVTCGTVGENAVLSLGCAAGRKIASVSFASYGSPTGTCPDVKTGTCHASQSQAVVEAKCLGKIACSIPATNDLFTDPCSGTIKSLTASITCA